MMLANRQTKKLIKLSDIRLKELKNNGYSIFDYYKIVNTEKANRTAEEYIKTLDNTTIIDNWNKAFYGDSSEFVISYMPKEAFDNFVLGNGVIGRAGDKGGQFVLPQKVGEIIESKLANKGSISNVTGEFKTALAKELGLPNDAFKTGVVKVEIPINKDIDLKMVTGIEDGCNYQWIPGGKTLGGTTEGIIRQITKVDDEELFNIIIERIDKR